MSVVALCSVRGAPGVTTLALLLAGCVEDSVVVEADLAGGVLAVRYGLGLEPGLTTLAAAADSSPVWWRDHAQVAGGVAVVVGPDSPATTEALWHRAGSRIARSMADAGTLVIADVGRIGSVASPMLDVADHVLVVVRPVAEHLIGLSRRLPWLGATTGDRRVGLVLVGTGPYREADIAEPLGVDIVATIPDDREAAAIVETGGSARSLRRSGLARAATGLADKLVAASIPVEVAS